MGKRIAQLHKYRYFLMVGAVLLLVGVIWHGYSSNNVWDRWVVNDDSLQQMPYFLRAQDPALFPDDIITEYMKFYVPPLYRTLFFQASRFWHPLDVGKAAHIFVFVAAALFAAAVGAQAGGPLCGFWAAFLVSTSSQFHDRAGGGLPRSFGHVLVLAFLAAEAWGLWPLSAAVVVLSAGFYPPVTLLLLLSWIFINRSRLAAIFKNPRHRIGAGGAFLLLILLLVWAHHKPDWMGSPVSFAKASSMAEWARGTGRFEELPWIKNGKWFFITWPLKNVIFANHFSYEVLLLGLLGGLTALLTKPGKKKWPPGLGPLLGVLAALPIAFGVSCALAFQLFIPARVIEFGLPPLLWSAAVVLPAALMRQTTGPGRSWLIVTAAITAGYLLSPFSFFQKFGYRETVTSEVLLCSFLDRLPKDALIAGAPADLDPVPLMAHRKVFINYETAHPLYDRYYAEITRRFRVLAQIYYATDKKMALELADREGITHLVLKQEYFEMGKDHRKAVNFEPYKSVFKAAKKAAVGRTYFFPPPKNAVVYTSGEYIIVELSRMKMPISAQNGDSN